MGKISKTRCVVVRNKRGWDKDAEARVLFLKYAFPCAGVTLARGAITQKEYDSLEKAARTSKPLQWRMLERIFVSAWRRIREVAASIHGDPHDSAVIRRYYLEFHNEYIKNNDGSYARAPEAFKKLCRVEKARIIKKGSDFYIVKIGAKKRPVSSMICPEAHVGDTVSVHYGYAVEKINAKMRFDSALYAFASPAQCQ